MTRYELYSTGSNSHGQLGLGTDEDASEYTQIPLPSSCRPLELAFGANHTLLLADQDGRRTLYGAGNNAAGQLGLGNQESRLKFEDILWENFVPRTAGVNEDTYKVVGVASTWETSLVHLRSRREEGSPEKHAKSDILVSFGSNDWGERGNGDGKGGGGSSVVSFEHVMEGPIRISRLVAGPRHVLALIESLDPSSSPSRTLVGWGASRHGQLGSRNSDLKLPKLVAQPEVVSLPSPFSSHDIVDFSCGRDHSAILLHPRASTSVSDPVIVTLGSNKHGQLGPNLQNDDSSKLSNSQKYNVLPFTSAIPSHPASFASTSNPPQTIHSTWNSTFIPLPFASDSTPFFLSFGSNSHGQLGNPTAGVSSMTLQSTANSTPASSTDIRIVSLSVQTSSSSLSSPSSPSSPSRSSIPSNSSTSQLQLSTGSEHVLALVEHPLSNSQTQSRAHQQQLFTWGWNEHGNLGLGSGDLADRKEPTRVGGVIGERLKEGGRIEKVWGGMATSWTLMSFERD
ncbi:uncharacterized protein JCM6883_005236 [Sporobolomyces salmoneus]|uniref:uncharacterized protein n=1 Tax=Sporobolomyces salmoneus TaxID=183962 RepID=UPI003171B91B